MIRWLIVVFVLLIVLNWAAPWLSRWGWARLPGDFRFRLFGRGWFLPFTSTVIVTLFMGGLAQLM